MRSKHTRGAGLLPAAVEEIRRLRAEWAALKDSDLLEASFASIKKTADTNNRPTQECHTRTRSATKQRSCEVLRGVVVLVEVGSEPRALPLRAALTALGATVVPLWSPLVTHVVWSEGGDREARAQARASAAHLVSPLWVEACSAADRRLAEKTFPATARQSDLPSPSTLLTLLKKAEKNNIPLADVIPKKGITMRKMGRPVSTVTTHDVGTSTSHDSTANTSRDSTANTSRDTTASRSSDTSAGTSGINNQKSRNTTSNDTTDSSTTDEETCVNTNPRRVLPRSYSSPGRSQSEKTLRKLFTQREVDPDESDSDPEPSEAGYGMSSQLTQRDRDGLARRMVQPGPSWREPSQGDPSRRDPSRRDPSRPDTSRPNPSRRDPSRRDPSRRDPSRRDPSRPDTSRPNPSRPDTSRPNPSRPDPSRVDPSGPREMMRFYNQPTSSGPVGASAAIAPVHAGAHRAPGSRNRPRFRRGVSSHDRIYSRDGKLRIVLTGMAREERHTVFYAARLLDAKVQKKVNYKTTHVVVGQDNTVDGAAGSSGEHAGRGDRERGPLRTVNSLEGAARGCRVVFARWVFDSVTARTWLSYRGYAVPYLQNIAEKAFVERRALDMMHTEYGFNVFRGRRVWLMMSTENRYAAVSLLALCGALVVDSNGPVPHLSRGNRHPTRGNRHPAHMMPNTSQRRQSQPRNRAVSRQPEAGDVVIGDGGGQVSSLWVFDSVIAGRARSTRRYMNSAVG